MENYEYIGDLGSGSYGFVWKCLQRSSGRVVAVKGFKLAHKDKKFLDQAIREVRMLRAACDHPNVVQLMEAFRSSSGRVYMVFEFVGRCLSSELHKRFTCGLPARQTRLVLWQLLAAVAHLHGKKIVHRDIKPGNLLMTSEGVVKLCDFGFARTTRVEPYKADRFSSYVVTRWYRSPEMLVSDLYCAASDIWSLGCTFAELATGRPLFPGNSSLDQLWRIMRCLGPLPRSQAERFAAAATAAGLPEAPPPPPRGKTLRQRLPELDPQLLEVLQACLQLDPTQRPTAAQLMQMPYFLEVPKLIVGTPLEPLYDEYGGAAAMGYAGRSRQAPKQVMSPPTAAAAPGYASAPVRGVASSALAQGELALSPRVRRDAALASERSGGVGGGAAADGGVGGAAGQVRPRPPSVLLSAVAASLLGELPSQPGGASGTVPLVSPRPPHEPPLVSGSDTDDGDAGGGDGRGHRTTGLGSLPAGAKLASGAATVAARGLIGAGVESHGQRHAPGQAPQHKRDQADDEEAQMLRKRRAAAATTAAAPPPLEPTTLDDDRAGSAAGGLSLAGSQGSYDGKGAAGGQGRQRAGALLSSDSILAGAAGSCAVAPVPDTAEDAGHALGKRAARGSASRRNPAIEDSCYAAPARPPQESAGRALSNAGSGRLGGRGGGSAGDEVLSIDRSSGGMAKRANGTGGGPDINGRFSTGGVAEPAAGGAMRRSRSGRHAGAEDRDPRVGLVPGVGLLDDDDEMMSSGDGHVSDDDELMEYFATKPQKGPGAADGSGAVARCSANAGGGGGGSVGSRLPKAMSVRARVASPVKAVSGGGAAGTSSDCGAAAMPRRAPSEGMHAGVQAVHHSLYGNGFRQRAVTGSSTMGRVGNRRVAALVSFGRRDISTSPSASSQHGSPQLAFKRATNSTFPSPSGASEALPLLTSPPAAAAAALQPQLPGIPMQPGVASPTAGAPPLLPPPLQPQLRASTSFGTALGTSSVEVSMDQLASLAAADAGHGSLPPLGAPAGHHATSVGFTLPTPRMSRASLPASGYLLTPGGQPSGALMSAGHQRRAVSRAGSTVFNQLMYDALPEIGTPGGAPEVPAGTPPRRRAVMSGFTPCRAAAERAAAAGVPPAAAMAAAMGDAMRSTVELSVAYSPIRIGGADGALSPDAHAGGGAPSQPRGCPSASAVAGGGSAAAAAARRYAQPHAHRPHNSLILPDVDRGAYAPMPMAPTSVSGGGPTAAGSGGGGNGAASAYRAQPYPCAGYARPHLHAAASDTGMLLGGSAPNATFCRPMPPLGATEAAVPSGGEAAFGSAMPAPAATGAVPIPLAANGRLPIVGLNGTGSGGPSPAATPSSRSYNYAPPLTPAGRSRLASGNNARVLEIPGAAAAHPRHQLPAEDTQSGELDVIPWANLGISPAGFAAPAPPPLHTVHTVHPHPHGQPVPPPSARSRAGRWASGLIDSLPEDRAVVHVNGDWRSSAGAGQTSITGEAPIQTLAVFSSESAVGGGTDATGAAALAAAAAASELRSLFASEVGCGPAAARASSPRSGSGHWSAASEGRRTRGGGEGSRHSQGEGSRHGGGEGSRHGHCAPLLSRISPRLRSSRSRSILEPVGAAAVAAGPPASPDVPRGDPTGSSGAANGRFLPPVVPADVAALSAPLPQRAPEMTPVALALAAAGASTGGKALKSRGSEAGNGRSGGSKWPRAKALLGGRFISSLVRKFKESSADK